MLVESLDVGVVRAGQTLQGMYVFLYFVLGGGKNRGNQLSQPVDSLYIFIGDLDRIERHFVNGIGDYVVCRFSLVTLCAQ